MPASSFWSFLQAFKSKFFAFPQKKKTKKPLKNQSFFPFIFLFLFFFSSPALLEEWHDKQLCSVTLCQFCSFFFLERKAFVILGKAVVNFSFFNGELKLAMVAPVLSYMKLHKNIKLWSRTEDVEGFLFAQFCLTDIKLWQLNDSNEKKFQEYLFFYKEGFGLFFFQLGQLQKHLCC